MYKLNLSLFIKYLKLCLIIIREIFLFFVANTLHCNMTATLQGNIAKGGHFDVSVSLHKHCNYVTQPICNITIFQWNIFAIFLQSFCAVWEGVWWKCWRDIWRGRNWSWTLRKQRSWDSGREEEKRQGRYGNGKQYRKSRNLDIWGMCYKRTGDRRRI